MTTKKAYHLDDSEDLIVLNAEEETDPEDKPLDAERIKELEGPIDQNAGLELPDISKIKAELARAGLELDGGRLPCSGGSFGPIFELKAIESKTGRRLSVIERTFAEVKDIERRYSFATVLNSPWKTDSEPRYEVVNKNDHHEDKLVIDYLYNEAKALEELQGKTGIPKFYGAVYDDMNGSILEEFIDGEDFSLMLMANKDGKKQYKLEELAAIVEKVKKTYTEAAEAGFIHNNPTGGTIMVASDGQPYLADWYLYSQGDIRGEGPIKDKYLQGLQDLETLEKDLVNYV